MKTFKENVYQLYSFFLMSNLCLFFFSTYSRLFIRKVIFFKVFRARSGSALKKAAESGSALKKTARSGSAKNLCGSTAIPVQYKQQQQIICKKYEGQNYLSVVSARTSLTHSMRV